MYKTPNIVYYHYIYKKYKDYDHPFPYNCNIIRQVTVVMKLRATIVIRL